MPTSLITFANDATVLDVTANTFNLYSLLTVAGANRGYSASKTFSEDEIGKLASMVFLGCPDDSVNLIYVADDSGVATTHYFKKLKPDGDMWDVTQLANAISLKNLWFRPAATGSKLAVYFRFF